MYVSLGVQITFFGCGLCLLQALERALEPGRRNVPGILFYLFNGVIMLGIGLLALGVPARYPGSIFLFLTALFAIGPLNLFYYHTLLYRNAPMPYRVGIHLAPAIVSLACEILFQALDGAMKRDIIGALLYDPLSTVLSAPLALGSLHIAGYAFFIMRVVMADIGIGRTGREFRFILFVAVSIVLVIGAVLGGFLAGKPAVFITGSILNVLIHISLYIGIRVHPQFFSALKRDIKMKRYEKSMLAGLDTAIISDRLVELMREERLYRDSEVSLASLAGRMSISPHQLSELLNERLRTGFHDFVNSFRVDEACEILRREPGASVIAVCFRVGFNTKSSFNAAFRKRTGLTPSEYRNGRSPR